MISRRRLVASAAMGVALPVLARAQRPERLGMLAQRLGLARANRVIE